MIGVVGVLAIAAGCGDDDDSGSATAGEGSSVSLTTSSLSEEQFVKQANALCRREKQPYDERILAFLNRIDPNTQEDLAALKAVQAVLVPITEAQIEGLRKLGAPEGDEEELGEALKEQEESLAEVEQMKRLEPGEVPTERFKEPTATLREHGLDDCIFFP